MKVTCAVWLLALAGCFDSLVTDPCAAGYAWSGMACAGRDAPDAAPALDASPGRDAADAAPPDTLTCTAPDMPCHGNCLDMSSDPNNCGGCDVVCPTGVCRASNCIGGFVGHIVAIGHDYTSYDPAMARVLGNALDLGLTNRLRVGFYAGTATVTSASQTVAAAAQGLSAIGRDHFDTMISNVTWQVLDGVDVLVIDAQTGDGDTLEALGATWAMPLALFLGRGGVVVVVEGAAGTSYRLARGAALYNVATPVVVTNQLVAIVDATDSVVSLVPSPYLAETTSVSFSGVTGVIASPAGHAVVFHLTR